MMDSQTPTMGLMRSVMPGRLPDYRGAQQSGDAVPLFGGQWRELTVFVRRIHRHLGWPCVGGGDSTSWLWGFKSEGGLGPNAYTHALFADFDLAGQK